LRDSLRIPLREKPQKGTLAPGHSDSVVIQLANGSNETRLGVGCTTGRLKNASARSARRSRKNKTERITAARQKGGRRKENTSEGQRRTRGFDRNLGNSVIYSFWPGPYRTAPTKELEEQGSGNGEHPRMRQRPNHTLGTTNSKKRG